MNPSRLVPGLSFLALAVCACGDANRGKPSAEERPGLPVLVQSSEPTPPSTLKAAPPQATNAVSQVVTPPEVKEDDAPPRPAEKKLPPPAVKERKPVPKDMAVLELQLPRGAKATLDGTEGGGQRRWEHGPLKPHEVLTRKLVVDFGGGQKPVERRLLLKGGWDVVIALADPRVPGPEPVLQRGHVRFGESYSDGILAVAYSPDGKLVATGGRDRRIILWEAQTGRSVRTFAGPDDPATSIAFSPDGKHLLVGTEVDPRKTQGAIAIWEIASGRLVRSVDNKYGWPQVAYTPDGKPLVLNHPPRWTDEKTEPGFVVWEAETGRVLFAPQPPVRFGAIVRFGPRQETVLVVAAKNANGSDLKVWDVKKGQIVSQLVCPYSKVDYAELLPDGKRVILGACLADRSSFAIYDLGSKELVREWSEPRFRVSKAMCDPSGRLLLALPCYPDPGFPQHTLICWDTDTGRKVASWDDTGERLAVCFSPNGKLIAMGYRWRTAALLEPPTGKVAQYLRGSDETVRSTAWSPDGKALLMSGYFGVVVYDFMKAPWHRSFSPGRVIGPVRWLPGGKEALLFRQNGQPGFWDLETGEEKRRFTYQSPAPGLKPKVDAFGFPIPSLPSPPKSERALLFAEGKELLTQDGLTISCWNIHTGEQRRTFSLELPKEHNIVKKGEVFDSSPNALAVSPDGRTLLVGCANFSHCAVTVHDGLNGRKLKTLISPPFSIGSIRWDFPVCFSPNGQWAATMDPVKKELAVWNTQSWQAIFTAQLPFDGLSLAFSLDNRWLLTSGRDGRMALCDLNAKTIFRQWQGHEGPVHSLEFHPNGRHFITGSDDGTARLWDLATGDEVVKILPDANGKDWLVCTPDGLFDGSPGGREKVNYRIGGGLNVVPVDRFFQDFYRPGLLASVLSGEPPRAEVPLGQQPPPLVRIVTPRENGTVEQPEIVIEAETTDEGGGIQGPWLLHNGTRMRTQGKVEKVGKVFKRTFSLLLAPGDNRIEVRAACADGSQDSEPAVLVLRYQKAPEKVRLHVLAVGVSKYAQTDINLKFAANDARTIAQLFESRGKNLFQVVKTRVLTDQEATQANIAKAVKAIAAEAKPEDVLIVFLAGHGTALGQRFFFIPHEFQHKAGATVEDDVRQQGLAGDVLANWLEEVRATKRVIIFDTCNSGAAVSPNRGGRDPFAFQGAIETLRRTNGAHTIAAAASGQEAKEVEELGHGVLTYTLLAGLKAVDRGPLLDKAIPPTNPEAVVDVFEWFQYAAGNVPRITAKYFQQQQQVSVSSSVQGPGAGSWPREVWRRARRDHRRILCRAGAAPRPGQAPAG